MTWKLSDRISLEGEGIKAADAERQSATAMEILRRFDERPGVILADEVGMGKTFVALAVAASVIEATGRRHPVVVMVPRSVGEKWPTEWEKFARQLGPGPELRATAEPVRSAADFLKLLDDPEDRRNHLIVMTHGALTSSLADPYMKLAILWFAFRKRRLKRQRERFPRWAASIIPNLGLDERTVDVLLSTQPQRWREVILRAGWKLDDDPVAASIIEALRKVDLEPMVETLLHHLPLASSRFIDARLKAVRGQLQSNLSVVWKQCLRELQVELPLLILDEAHHTKNAGTRLAKLFANEPGATADAEALHGELGEMFHRMLFLTATPFQLGHNELIEVLRRFTGIRWSDLDRAAYEDHLTELGNALDAAQRAALTLDQNWGRLTPGDLPDLDGWWERPADEAVPEGCRSVAAAWARTREHTVDAQRLLAPLVVRHLRPDRDERRDEYCGEAIATGDPLTTSGLPITGDAVLPFLLAARAQAVVSASGARGHVRTRALFADGLASSFEAYRHTRSGSSEAAADDRIDQTDPLPAGLEWYLDHITTALPDGSAAFAEHPKMRATIDRTLALWRQREKVLVFCFYRATGRALRLHIAQAVADEVQVMAAASLGVAKADPLVADTLKRVQTQLYDADSRASRVASEQIRAALGYTLSGDAREEAADRCLRFLRTDSFLARYVDLAARPADALAAAFLRPDGSGRTLKDVIGDFAAALHSQEETERRKYLDDLGTIEVGDIAFRDDESEQAESLIANVRLANGAVKPEQRQRLMRTFNTPFFPDVLIASSVMAEGVDLHLHCRHVIHHDLDWNPSTIEQRTGRLDRMRSKGEVTGKPVVVYEPFVEGTQDEKMFRVMKDRERWFNVVMGERLELDEASTDRLAARVPFPEAAATGLAMDLSVWSESEG